MPEACQCAHGARTAPAAILLDNKWNYGMHPTYRCECLLKEGQLSEINLGDIGVRSVALILRHGGEIITSINLTGTGITDVGAKHLAELLKTSLPALEYLCLAKNDITPGGKAAITRALACHRERHSAE